MYYIYAMSGPSLLTESTDSMIQMPLASLCQQRTGYQTLIIVLCTIHGMHQKENSVQ